MVVWFAAIPAYYAYVFVAALLVGAGAATVMDDTQHDDERYAPSLPAYVPHPVVVPETPTVEPTVPEDGFDHITVYPQPSPPITPDTDFPDGGTTALPISSFEIYSGHAGHGLGTAIAFVTVFATVMLLGMMKRRYEAME